MLYINDLDFENGAFCLSPGSHHWVKKCLGNTRQAHGAKGFLELSRDIPDFIKDRLISVESKMGTIIIFDTDCIHHQGICQFGQASIIRAHYREVRHRFLTKMVKTLYISTSKLISAKNFLSSRVHRQNYKPKVINLYRN